MTDKTNKFIQHMPSYVEADRFEYAFDKQEELLNHPWIKEWSKDEGFHRYSLSNQLLIAEFEQGKKWWVLGYIKHPEYIDLPVWEPKK